MSDEINQQKKNKLAKTLGDSWKAFAEAVPLSTALISSIEVEERNEEDRAHRVLLLWYRSSPDEFTNTNVIKKLKTLHRNDIILDVFGQEFLADKVDGVIPPRSSCGAPTVSDLSFSQISKLADMLDFDDNGWEDFAAFAFENDDVMQENIQNLHRYYYGGGNPAHSFLIKLVQRYPMLTVKEFVNKCKECKRNDIVLYASKVLKKDDSTLMDLEDSELRDLADKVCGKGFLDDWREIASTFPEFSPDDIRKLDGTRRLPNNFSPTRKLFEKIRQVHPTFKLEDLAISCEKNSRPRNDVALKLRNIIAELLGK